MFTTCPPSEATALEIVSLNIARAFNSVTRVGVGEYNSLNVPVEHPHPGIWYEAHSHG